MKDYVIGFDVGGTRLKSGAVTRRGKMMAPGINPSGFALGMGNLLKALRGEDIREIGRQAAGDRAGFSRCGGPGGRCGVFAGQTQGARRLSDC